MERMGLSLVARIPSIGTGGDDAGSGVRCEPGDDGGVRGSAAADGDANGSGADAEHGTGYDGVDFYCDAWYSSGDGSAY
jgi:hypothetical protein